MKKLLSMGIIVGLFVMAGCRFRSIDESEDGIWRPSGSMDDARLGGGTVQQLLAAVERSTVGKQH